MRASKLKTGLRLPSFNFDIELPKILMNFPIFSSKSESSKQTLKAAVGIFSRIKANDFTSCKDFSSDKIAAFKPVTKISLKISHNIIPVIVSV